MCTRAELAHVKKPSLRLAYCANDSCKGSKPNCTRLPAADQGKALSACTPCSSSRPQGLNYNSQQPLGNPGSCAPPLLPVAKTRLLDSRPGLAASASAAAPAAEGSGSPTPAAALSGLCSAAALRFPRESRTSGHGRCGGCNLSATGPGWPACSSGRLGLARLPAAAKAASRSFVPLRRRGINAAPRPGLLSTSLVGPAWLGLGPSRDGGGRGRRGRGAGEISGLLRDARDPSEGAKSPRIAPSSPLLCLPSLGNATVTWK